MGRSRGGLTSKIHALVDAEGRPVTLRLTGGQVADCKEAEALLDALGEGDILLADKGYDSDAIRAKAKSRDARPLGKNPAQRQTARAPSPSFPPGLYRQRNFVERFFNPSNHFRGIATRYDKDPANLPRRRQARRQPASWCLPVMSLRPRLPAVACSLSRGPDQGSERRQGRDNLPRALSPSRLLHGHEAPNFPKMLIHLAGASAFGHSCRLL